MFLIAHATFLVCSAASGAAPTIQLLVVGRLLQGLAAGLLAPQNSGLIQDLFTGAERARASGTFGTTVGLSTALGPARRRADPGFGERHGRPASDLS